MDERWFFIHASTCKEQIFLAALISVIHDRMQSVSINTQQQMSKSDMFLCKHGHQGQRLPYLIRQRGQERVPIVGDEMSLLIQVVLQRLERQPRAHLLISDAITDIFGKELQFCIQILLSRLLTAASQPASQPVAQSVSQPVSQPVSQTASESYTQRDEKRDNDRLPGSLYPDHLTIPVSQGSETTAPSETTQNVEGVFAAPADIGRTQKRSRVNLAEAMQRGKRRELKQP